MDPPEVAGWRLAMAQDICPEKHSRSVGAIELKPYCRAPRRSNGLIICTIKPVVSAIQWCCLAPSTRRMRRPHAQGHDPSHLGIADGRRQTDAGAPDRTAARDP